LFIVVALAGLIFFGILTGKLFNCLGSFVIAENKPERSDVIVVLHTGVEYYPRLIEAADLFSKGLADTIIINGNRKTDVLRELERKGFEPCCSWDEDFISILSLLGVPRNKVISVSAEDVYETVGEAEVVGAQVIQKGYKSMILVTSKYHTKRAGHIWSEMYEGKLSVCSVGARTDPFDASRWWKDGRQIRWLMAEYGAWIYYYWKKAAAF
jgi:uncharacterized SAM-binding protein YcdF (DUF218 family)